MNPSDERSAGVAGLAEHLFREESGKLVSALTGIFGIHRLQLAEDVVQEAMVRALQTWPYHGVPENPAAWLMRTARNRALDLIRREKRFSEKREEIAATLEEWPEEGESPRFEEEIRDHRLRLVFACCHPKIAPEDRTALALKTLCGFSIAEIAAAFLAGEAAIAKRLTRAKSRIQELGIPFEIPAGEELEPRLESVLRVIYLLFNEGYKASSGDSVVRADLCHEAIRLAEWLAAHPAGDRPETHALLALMQLDAARLPAREDADGNLLRLEEQDRGLWDRRRIALGLMHLSRSATGDVLGEYHLQAGIAACHCTAADDASTDWPRILFHYDHWMSISDSPVVALNRAVAVARVHGPQAGMDALEPVRESGLLDGYHLLHAVHGDFEFRLGNLKAAAGHFRRALQLTGVTSERTFLTGRLGECEVEGS